MIAEQRIKEYLEILKSDAPAPGGGAVAALTGAQGAALIMMVANLTIGKKKYGEFEELNKAVRKETDMLLEDLIRGADEDRKAFEKVSEAYCLPKSSEEEKGARSDAIAIASIGAAAAPLAVMKTALRALTLCDQLVGRSNNNLITDLYVAALNLDSCIRSAAYNVKANIPYIKDKKHAADLKKETADIEVRSKKLTSKILNTESVYRQS